MIEGVVRWRRIDLKRMIEEIFGVVYHGRTIGRLLKQIGFFHIGARPLHPAQDERVIKMYKSNFAAMLKAHLAHVPKRK